MNKPKLLIVLLAVLIIGLISVLGGALGDAFGLGFLGSPIPFISVPAERVATVAGYDIINTSIMFWAAMIVIILAAWRGTRNMQMVPTGMQNFVELLVEGFIGLAESVGGPPARRFLPLVMTIFLAVIVSNWLGILPGVGTIGRIESVEEIVEHDTHSALDELSGEEIEEAVLLIEDKMTIFDGEGVKYIPFGRGENTKIEASAIIDDDGNDPAHDVEAGLVVSQPEGYEYPELVGEDKTAGVLVPFLRGPNTSINTTLAIAIVAMVMIHFYGFSTLGLKGHGGKFVNLKQGPIFFAVGLLEIVSEVSRVISFTFRLFGNMFAGEVLLVAMGFLFPLVGIIPFLGLELFVGAIQAFIFAMLTLVFAVVATAAHGDEGH